MVITKVNCYSSVRIMYEIPKDKNIGKVTITKEYIEKTGGPVIEMRTAGFLPE